MTKKMMLVAASALAAIAFASLPAIASAATPSVHFTKPNPKFKGTFGAATLTAVGQEEIICTGENHVTGQWTTKEEGGTNTSSTGHIALTFTNCHPKETPGIACTTAGQAAGTIVVASSEFHLVYITSDVKEPKTMFVKTVGLLVTPPKNKEGVTQPFAQFSCSFLINIKVAGNGILGHVTTPKCDETSATSTVDFHSNSTGVQTYQLAENDANTYSLTSSLNGGAAVKASEDVTSTTTLEEGTGQLTCP